MIIFKHMKTLNELPDVLTKIEVQDYLRISPATLNRYMKSGIIKRVPNFWEIRILKSEMIKFIENL